MILNPLLQGIALAVLCIALVALVGCSSADKAKVVDKVKDAARACLESPKCQEAIHDAVKE